MEAEVEDSRRSVLENEDLTAEEKVEQQQEQEEQQKPKVDPTLSILEGSISDVSGGNDEDSQDEDEPMQRLLRRRTQH